MHTNRTKSLGAVVILLSGCNIGVAAGPLSLRADGGVRVAVDAGRVTPRDSGTPPRDSSSVSGDAGFPLVGDDAAPEDGGTTQDAGGPAEVDAYVPPPPPALSFETHVYPILAGACMSCHSRWGTDAASIYASLVGMPHNRGATCTVTAEVAPNDLDNSLLYLKLVSTPTECGGLMPRARPDMPFVPLPEEQIAIVRDWIMSNAQP